MKDDEVNSRNPAAPVTRILLKLLPFDPRLYLLRLRHASVVEVVHQIRKGILLAALRVSAKWRIQPVRPPRIEPRNIENLQLPDLIAEDPADGDGWPASNHPNRLAGEERVSRPWDGQDIRMAWETGRLQQAVKLLAYARQSNDVEASRHAQRAAKSMVWSWIEANPFPIGIHYQSAMECALRIIVFFCTLKLTDELTDSETECILGAIYRHAFLISKSLSLHASLGNHTVTEAVGLVFAGAVYRSTQEGTRWLATGMTLLNEELFHQVLDDGGPIEQSIDYHRFILDLYWLTVDFVQKNSLGDVTIWIPRLLSGEMFCKAFEDRNGNSPSIGDSDDGFAVAPGIVPARGSQESSSTRLKRFESSGYSLVTDDKLHFSFDHGPLGMPPLFNHGHADALAITMSREGKPFLIDSGTYRYNGVPPWRKYFKGTRAHNTVTIDGLDQAIQETGFIWSAPFQSKLAFVDEDEQCSFWSASHNGYLRLDDPVCHHRSILFCDGACLLIQDQFTGTGVHRFELNYHLHPDVSVQKSDAWWELDNDGVRIYMRILDGDFHTSGGAVSPILGWFSPRYGRKVPTTVLTHAATGHVDDVVFRTAIFIRKSIV